MNRKELLETMAKVMYQECCDFSHKHADRVTFKPRPWSELKDGDRLYWTQQADCATDFVIKNLEDFANVMQLLSPVC